MVPIFLKKGFVRVQIAGDIQLSPLSARLTLTRWSSRAKPSGGRRGKDGMLVERKAYWLQQRIIKAEIRYMSLLT